MRTAAVATASSSHAGCSISTWTSNQYTNTTSEIVSSVNTALRSVALAEAVVICIFICSCNSPGDTYQSMVRTACDSLLCTHIPSPGNGFKDASGSSVSINVTEDGWQSVSAHRHTLRRERWRICQRILVQITLYKTHRSTRQTPSVSGR